MLVTVMNVPSSQARIPCILFQHLLETRGVVTWGEEGGHEDAVVIDPGAAPQPWTGLLGDMVGSDLSIVRVMPESPEPWDFVGLRALQLKAMERYLSSERFREYEAPTARLILLNGGWPNRAYRMAFDPKQCEDQSVGVIRVSDRHPTYIVQMNMVALSTESAFLHVLSGSSRANQALELLAGSSDWEVRRYFDRMLEVAVDRKRKSRRAVANPDEKLALKPLTESWLKLRNRLRQADERSGRGLQARARL